MTEPGIGILAIDHVRLAMRRGRCVRDPFGNRIEQVDARERGISWR